MNVRNCPRCGAVFRPIGGRRICRDCVEKEQREFEAVREYLKENPSASVVEVSEATGVPTKKILDFVREGRLIPASDDWAVKCEQCGASISKGRLCATCSARLQEGFRGRGPSASPAPMPAPLPSAQPRPVFPTGKKVVRDRFRRR